MKFWIEKHIGCIACILPLRKLIVPDTFNCFILYNVHLFVSVHDYRYLDPFFEDSVYRIPRLASEYGLQSYPSHETLEKVYLDSDMDFWSDLNEHRQHHPGGKSCLPFDSEGT